MTPRTRMDEEQTRASYEARRQAWQERTGITLMSQGERDELRAHMRTVARTERLSPLAALRVRLNSGFGRHEDDDDA